MNEVVLRNAQWTPEVEMMMDGAISGDPTYTLADLKMEITRGTAKLYKAVDISKTENEILGYVVLHIDPTGTARELVLQAGAAFVSVKNALKRTMPALIAEMHEKNCVHMRAHTNNSAVMRALRVAGFREAERVFRF